MQVARFPILNHKESEIVHKNMFGASRDDDIL